MDQLNSQTTLSQAKKKSKAIAILLTWFTAFVGGHWFYLGNKKKAYWHILLLLPYTLLGILGAINPAFDGKNNNNIFSEQSSLAFLLIPIFLLAIIGGCWTIGTFFRLIFTSREKFDRLYNS